LFKPTSRLLLLLSCYYAGLEVGRYISLERLIEQNKERYYEVLKLSSDGWHQGKHDPGTTSTLYAKTSVSGVRESKG
jgi:hypothetical protein